MADESSSPAGRASYAEGGHFVTCIPPSGRGSRWSLRENLSADHREAHGEAGIPVTK
jgi:hypothetical protein